MDKRYKVGIAAVLVALSGAAGGLSAGGGVVVIGDARLTLLDAPTLEKVYMGKVVEQAKATDIFHDPLHPYTQGLMESIPALTKKKDRLKPIKGVVPDPYNLPKGCPFEPRCPHAMDICREQMPPLKDYKPNHKAACWLYE